MKLKDLEKINALATTKRSFEHAFSCVGEGVETTIAYHPRTGEKLGRGGQLQLRLDGRDVEALKTVFARHAARATADLELLGVDVGE